MPEYWQNKSSGKLIDIHSHIIPNVDDGSGSFEESIDMLNEASNAGIFAIIATPHLYNEGFETEKANENFKKLKEKAAKYSIELYRGFEVNVKAIAEFGFGKLEHFCFEDTDTLLLEFDNYSFPPNWQGVIRAITEKGINVIIAHPERYKSVIRNIKTAKEMVNLGCSLQIDADVFTMSLLSPERRTAKKLLNAGLVSWIASDAHCANDYLNYQKAMKIVDKRHLRSAELVFFKATPHK